jgi:polysaccharide biosynthesis transport protein
MPGDPVAMADSTSPDGHPLAPTVSPFELLAIVWRRRAVVAVVLVASIVVALALSLHSPKRYSSSAQLLFRDPGFAQALFGNGLFQNGPEEPQRTTQTNIDVVTSLSVATRAEREVHTGESPETLLKSISVAPSSNANIAVITATRSTPRGAAAVANAFANGYVVYRRETDRALIGQAEELVSQSLKTAVPAEVPKLETSLHQLRVLRALQTGDGEVIAGAQPNGNPVSPKPARDALLGGVLGLLLGCGLALLVDFLDRRLKTTEDVERAYGGYPLIAAIPRAPEPIGGVGMQALEGVVGESYRMLRESLRFLDPSGTACCFVITSAEEGEGKSTVAVNLALALATVGRKVVLVEADMRRPTAAAQLGIQTETRGLSDLLISRDRVEDYLLEVPGVENVKVLASGTTPPNSADLLSAERMSGVLSDVRDAADIVLIDSPPLLPVADTRVLLRMQEIDGVVLVARAGTSRRDSVRAARAILEQSGRRVFGLVVTGVSSSLGSYYYENPSPPRGGGARLRRPVRPDKEPVDGVSLSGLARRHRSSGQLASRSSDGADTKRASDV